MKPSRVAALVVSGLSIGAAGAVLKKKLGELMTWRSRRMWKMTARNAGRYAGTRARRIITPAERRAELDTQFAIRTAEDVAKELGEMKGVLMKVGQMISFIAEGLPEEAQQALAALQADAAPMAPSLAASVIRDELGRDPERVFASWEDMPVAAASIGQVHRATDSHGRQLAVKVQFPGVSEAIEEDLDAAEVMYAVFSALALNGLDARALVDELRARMREELDYRKEAANILEFAERFAGHPWVRIPILTPEFSTARVLTTEWVEGMSWNEFLARETGPTKQRAAEVIWRFAQHSVHRVGAFNGDPHPGNYRFHHDGSVTFLDFGLVKRWDAGEWERLEPTLDAIVVARDPDQLVVGDGGRRVPRRRPRSRPAAGLRLRVDAIPPVPRRRVHVHARLDEGDAGSDHRHRRALRRRDRQIEHAGELRHPRSGRVGCECDPRQARGDRPVASDAARVPDRRVAGDRARCRRAELAHVNPATRIDDLAARASRWIALEDLLFETLGGWARAVPEPPVKRLLATWCHRHAWHAELWRARLPHIPARTDGPDHTADVAAWIAPLQRVLSDPGTATTTAAKLAVIADSLLAAMQSALDEHRAKIDDRLDGPTSRILDLVGTDLAAERRALDAAITTFV